MKIAIPLYILLAVSSVMADNDTGMVTESQKWGGFCCNVAKIVTNAGNEVEKIKEPDKPGFLDGWRYNPNQSVANSQFAIILNGALFSDDEKSRIKESFKKDGGIVIFTAGKRVHSFEDKEWDESASKIIKITKHYWNIGDPFAACQVEMFKRGEEEQKNQLAKTYRHVPYPLQSGSIAAPSAAEKYKCVSIESLKSACDDPTKIKKLNDSTRNPEKPEEINNPWQRPALCDVDKEKIIVEEMKTESKEAEDAARLADDIKASTELANTLASFQKDVDDSVSAFADQCRSAGLDSAEYEFIPRYLSYWEGLIRDSKYISGHDQTFKKYSPAYTEAARLVKGEMKIIQDSLVTAKGDPKDEKFCTAARIVLGVLGSKGGGGSDSTYTTPFERFVHGLALNGLAGRKYVIAPGRWVRGHPSGSELASNYRVQSVSSGVSEPVKRSSNDGQWDVNKQAYDEAFKAMEYFMYEEGNRQPVGFLQKEILKREKAFQDVKVELQLSKDDSGLPQLIAEADRLEREIAELKSGNNNMVLLLDEDAKKLRSYLMDRIKECKKERPQGGRSSNDIAEDKARKTFDSIVSSYPR